MGLGVGGIGGVGSCSCGGFFTSTGVILVLFILLVIVSRSFI
ncbi:MULTISPECIES: YjcZ family sporulation protein [Paenibacillus]|uniref:YjcZ family sporulation protein n=1 Tax=Paenibacillus radicis (ex Xue et al. 2023) TaxID=2972489 RepID=A0ABT1YCG9_9BACL|nr:YjcZ family sporulation protein [Paenibacillus radicis (ex Xue et al. 2023)]MCR8630872.1 YjcZ family sporulation protein [Paenibacillus radicis (ex Xue et al. 2023)]